MEDNNLRPIEDTPKDIDISLPNLKEIKEIVEEPKPVKDEILSQLPEWSIEPPIEINRGQK